MGAHYGREGQERVMVTEGAEDTWGERGKEGGENTMGEREGVWNTIMLQRFIGLMRIHWVM